ncbi:MAG: hypothetical protein HRU09_16725 [Oligoflexales bacterium]|nr:hypothetical protein [Oligoflexales bacterium]
MVINRRDIMYKTMVAAGGAIATVSVASQNHHQHHKKASEPLRALQETTGVCLSKGLTCSKHCLDLMYEGDLSLKECKQSVDEMLVYCDSVFKLSHQGSSTLPKLTGT